MGRVDANAGGLIMCHGDDFGLVVPPALAPVQAVVMVVKDTDGAVARVASALVEELNHAGYGRDWTTTSTRASAGAPPSGICKACPSELRRPARSRRERGACSTAETPAARRGGDSATSSTKCGG